MFWYTAVKKVLNGSTRDHNTSLAPNEKKKLYCIAASETDKF